MKHGLVWELSSDDFSALVKSCRTFTEIIKRCGYRNVGGGYRMVKKRINLDKIDDSHLSKGLNANKGKVYRSFKRIPPTQLFCENSVHVGSVVRRNIIRHGLLPYQCEKCGQLPEWQGEQLTLVLDHKNGINNDHRLTNLRFLCPNCNSQTLTYGGRNTKKTRMKNAPCDYSCDAGKPKEGR